MTNIILAVVAFHTLSGLVLLAGVAVASAMSPLRRYIIRQRVLHTA